MRNFWPRCESTKPPPLTRAPQGDLKPNDPLVHPSGSLHFYAEIRGFFASPHFDGVETTGRGRHLLAPEKAQIGAKGSKPRDDPQPRPVLKNPAKHGTFAISNRREVLAKMPGGGDMKNLTIASRGATGWMRYSSLFQFARMVTRGSVSFVPVSA